MSATDDEALALLARGRDLLASGDLIAAGEALARARTDARTRLAAHNLIERHRLADAFGHWMGLNCEIAPQDDIYRFFERHPSSLNPLRDYLADGWRTLSELMVLLEQVDRSLLHVDSFMEFASGHGRFTRHLVKALGAERVTVADVVGDAMAFARGAFEVEALDSSTVPEQFRWPRRYEVVFVLSLFSHLPRATWGRWLKCLYQGVAPGGVLVFSTHGAEAVRRQGVELAEDGFFFAPASESQAIDAEDYGTAFTSEAFVRAQVAAQIGSDCIAHFAPAHFWAHQDAWVLRA